MRRRCGTSRGRAQQVSPQQENTALKSKQYTSKADPRCTGPAHTTRVAVLFDDAFDGLSTRAARAICQKSGDTQARRCQLA